MKRVEKKSLLLSLSITMSITGLLLYQYKLKVDTAKANIEPLVKVVIAASDIKANSIVKDSEIQEVTIPQKFVVPKSLTNKNDIVGKVAKEDMFTGEQILPGRLIQGKEQEGLSAILPNGYRAITLKVDMVSGVGGNIKKGDFVDVLVYLKPPYSGKDVVKTVFQNIKILDINNQGNNQSDSVYLTLCMTPQDSEKLFLTNKLGEIRLVLKQISDRTLINILPIGGDSLN